MAKLTLVLALMLMMIVLLSFSEVQGRRGDKPWRVHKGQGRLNHRDYQRDKSHHNDKSRNNGHDKKNDEKSHEKEKEHHRGRRFNDRSQRGSFELTPSHHDFGNFWFTFHSGDSWWKGPNVCENESEVIVNSTEKSHLILRHFSTNIEICDQSETVYKCKTVQESVDGRREVTHVYECCHGFTRTKGDFGCPNKVKMLNLIEKAEELGLTDFLRALKTLKLTQHLEKGNFTVFVPENGAFSLDSDLLDSGSGIILRDAPEVIAVSEPAIDQALKSLQNAILGHMVLGAIRSSSMEDEELLESGSPEGTEIRINYFSRPEKLMTANCVTVVTRDHMATNGIIHTVQKVLKPIKDSLLDIVKTRPELSTLKTVLAAANYESILEDKGQMTLIAPTNSAFDKMNSRLRDRLLSGDRKCLERVLQNHLLPNVICSAAIQGQARTPNQLQHYLNVTRSEEDKIFVEGAEMVLVDAIGTNGVLHAIDEVLVPDEALSFLDILEKEGFTEFINLIEKAGLSKTLETTSNVTVFAPTNEAIQSLPVAVKTKLSEDSNLLRDVLSYHVSPGLQECHHLRDNQRLPSLAGPEIRFNSFSLFPFDLHNVRTAQCSPIEEMNIDACNGRINVIRDIMTPPKGNVLDVLALDKKFSTLVSLIKKAGVADALQEEGPFTVFAPNNEAFDKLGQEKLNNLSKDPKTLEQLLKRHIMEDTLCCAGIVHWFGHPKVRTLSGDHLRLSRNRDNKPKVGHAVVVKCDITATNGNVLELDRVLIHEPPHQRWRFNPFSHWWGMEP